jgi:hypothetical protein
MRRRRRRRKRRRRRRRRRRRNNIWCGIQTMRLFIMQLSPLSSNFPLGSDIFLSTLLSNILIECSCLNMRDQKF